jgi:hypothetical protein
MPAGIDPQEEVEAVEDLATRDAADSEHEPEVQTTR